MPNVAETTQSLQNAIREIESLLYNAKPNDRQRLIRLGTILSVQIDNLAGIPPESDPLVHLTKEFRAASGRINTIIADATGFTSSLKKATALVNALGSLASLLALA